MGNFINNRAFLPPKESSNSSLSCLPHLFIETSHNTIIPIIYIKRRKSVCTVIFSHGNAELITDNYNWLRFLSDRLNIDILSYEYDGYGYSRWKDPYSIQLTPNESFIYGDIEAAWNFLISRNVDPSKILLYGRSIGTGPTVHLASKVSCGGVILQAPFCSIVRVAYYTPFTLPFDIFANIDKINRIRNSLLIIHGSSDKVIPIDHGKELFNRALCKKDHLWITGADHNDIETNFTRISVDNLEKFIESCLPDRN